MCVCTYIYIHIYIYTYTRRISAAAKGLDLDHHSNLSGFGLTKTFRAKGSEPRPIHKDKLASEALQGRQGRIIGGSFF